MHQRLYLDELPDRAIPRGVYRLRAWWEGRGGVRRPVLVVIDSQGRVRGKQKLHVVPRGWRLDDAWDALEQWLDRKDPVPQLQLVRDVAPPLEPRVITGPAPLPPGARTDGDDPYALRILPRAPRPFRARPAREKKPGHWSWDQMFATPYRLGRGVEPER